MAGTRLGRSQSMPGISKIGTDMPITMRPEGFGKRANFTGGDLKGGLPVHPDVLPSAEFMRNPSWRALANEMANPPKEEMDLEDIIPKNMRQPTQAPAWMKHEKQVLRFYGYFQETVTERPDENARYRSVIFMFFMEDGTLMMSEPKVENSGIPQGSFLKRHKVPRDDGSGMIGPDDFRCGQQISFYGRTYHITGCDRFTRWFYEENGIDVGEDEPMVQDLWQKTYRMNKTIEKGGVPPSKNAMDAKNQSKYQIGQPPADKRFIQFLLNDRKVLRFQGYWDDPTLYGARFYLEIQYYLADNTVLINERHARNSGRPAWPIFMKRGPLYRVNKLSAYPNMLGADHTPYQPEDLIVGEPITVWGRQVVLYECDEFTRNFYKEYMGIDQAEGKIDVSEKPLRHKKLHPPPHNGIGSPEDSLISCQMVMPKAPKQDLVKLMTLTGEVLRFECRIFNPEPEDEPRRFVIAFYPGDDQTAVFEIPQRNSGHMAGKFADKRRIMNVDTGKYFELADFYVGKVVTVAGMSFHIVRADERCLQFLEARPDQFPYADPVACAKRVAPLAEMPEMQSEVGMEPDQLKAMAEAAGVDLADHEVITLLRKCHRQGEAESAQPRIYGPAVLDLMRS